MVRNALSMRRLQSENQVLKRQLTQDPHEREIIGKSEEMTKVFKMLDKVADTESTILVYGESGTGKELIAREIHYRSHRCQRSVRLDQLRRAAEGPARVEPLRPHPRLLHRRDQGPAGALHGLRERDLLPRRGRGDGRRPPR